MTREDEAKLLELERREARRERLPEVPVSPQPGPPTLAQRLGVVLAHRWLVLAAVAGALALGLAYLAVATPIYAANVVVQVEDRSSAQPRLDERAPELPAEPPGADAEMEIIRSRSLLDGVVEELKLDLEVRPRTFPVIGAAIARAHRGPGLAPALLGMDRDAWGGERLRVDRLEVSDDLLDQPLTLVAEQDKAFRLEGPHGRVLARAREGLPVTWTDGTRRVSAFVSELVARPGTEFTLRRRPRADVVEALQRQLQIAEKGKKTGILSLDLEGSDPRQVAAVLDGVADAYLRQNVERKSEEASKTLAFLEAQLPVLKDRAASAEAALSAYRLKRGTVDISRETQALLDRTTAADKALSEAELAAAELSQRFTGRHPLMAAAEEKVSRLRAERAEAADRMRELPRTEMESAQLARDAKASNELYLAVLNKVQELRVLKSGMIGYVRILDHAVVPSRPVRPAKVPVMALALLLGGALGIGGAFARHALQDMASDPEAIERATGVSVYASVPHSGGQERLERRSRRRGLRPLLAAADPGDLAVENLRSLRTSLQFALAEARSGVVALLGPRPGVGKSFVAVNLAHVLASADRRVLLVDGDLRRGRLHRHFGLRRGPGLTDVLTGEGRLEQAIRRTVYERLDLLPTGTVPPNPAELLGSERFNRLLQELSGRYDLVVVDTPPVLAVTDAVIVARAAGVNLLVLRAGLHPMREIVQAVRRVTQTGATVHGAVLNDVVLTRRHATEAGYYHYEYRSLPAR